MSSVVNNAPMQTLLLTAAVAPAAVVFAAPNSAGQASAARSVGSSGGAEGAGGGAGTFGGSGLPTVDGGAVPDLIVVGGSFGGPIIDGDAVSIGIGDLSGGSAADSAKVPVIIAQYN